MRNRILKYSLGMALICVGIYVLFYSMAEPAASHSYFNSDRFLVIAHRGGRSLGPESTLYTFKRAVEIGVDVIEIDAHTTKDGHLVIIHDDTVNRTTSGKGTVNSLTLKELQSLDAGYHWSPDNGRTYPLRGHGLTVPTLAEATGTHPSTVMRTLDLSNAKADPL